MPVLQRLLTVMSASSRRRERMRRRVVVQLDFDARPRRVLVPARLDEADLGIARALQGEEHL